MFKFIWNYLKGYVTIKITGFSAERFINLCLNKNINLYEIKEDTNGILCNVYIKNFKDLKQIGKKTGCKYKIVYKYGAPFYIFKNKKRATFLIGAFAFIFLLYYFSSFIWHIKVVGNTNIDNNQILSFCKQNGLYLGAYKKDIDNHLLQEQIKNNFDTISFVNVQIKGTKTTIKISENIQTKNTTQTEQPCDIIAKETGVITEIVTKTGRPLVKAKDVVKKGDILVSGELFLKDGEQIIGTYNTYSDAIIKAKTTKNIQISVPYEYYTKEFTNNKKIKYELIFFDKVFSLNLFKNDVNYKNYDIIINRTQLKLTKDFYLPFIIKKTEYREYIPKKNVYTEKEAQLYANKLLTEKITETIDFSSDILDKQISYEQTNDKLIATATLTLIEDIAQKAPISITYTNEGSNTPNGASENTNSQ